MGNNREAFEEWYQNSYICFGQANFHLNSYGEYVDDDIEASWCAWQAALASKAQQPTDISKQLREYAEDSGYSHNDYADTMLAAASEIDRLNKRIDDLEDTLNYYKNMVGA